MRLDGILWQYLQQCTLALQCLELICYIRVPHLLLCQFIPFEKEKYQVLIDGVMKAIQSYLESLHFVPRILNHSQDGFLQHNLPAQANQIISEPYHYDMRPHIR
jgi:hypothetical protein